MQKGDDQCGGWADAANPVRLMTLPGLPPLQPCRRRMHLAQHPAGAAAAPALLTLWSSSGGSCCRPLLPLPPAPPAGAFRCRRLGPLPMPAGPPCPRGAWCRPLAAAAPLSLLLAGSAARFTRARSRRPYKEAQRGGPGQAAVQRAWWVGSAARQPLSCCP